MTVGANNTNEPVKLRDTVRGKKHRFFDAQGVDELVSICMSLAQELWVVKERQLALEQAAEAKGIRLVEDPGDPDLSAGQLAALEAERSAFIDRIFFVLREQAESLNGEDPPEPPEI